MVANPMGIPMTDAVLEPPMHPRKQVKCFGDMSKNDQHQASCAE